MAPGAALLTAVRDGLTDAADPARAPRMQAYMKSTMPYLGVPLPTVRSVVRTAARAHPPADLADMVDTARTLWREATHREHRYAATELTGTPGRPVPRGTADVLRLLPLYEEMITTGAWWDHVDAVAPRLRDLLTNFPAELRPVLLTWSTAEDPWLRRASIVAQIGARTATDRELLVAVIDANAAERGFFVRKAIGWALRDYARTDPEWVRQFVDARTDTLSNLSRREAVRRLT